MRTSPAASGHGSITLDDGGGITMRSGRPDQANSVFCLGVASDKTDESGDRDYESSRFELDLK